MTDPSQPGEPFVMVPVELMNLVADGKVTKNGAWLYVLLLGHLNYKRGDGKVWPSRKSLSQRMNLGQVRGVDKYIDELTDAGLITCDRRRDGKVNDTNLYTLQLLPARQGVSQVSAAQGVVRSSALPSASERTRGSAPESTRVVRHSAPELEEVELEENQLDETPSPSPLDVSGEVVDAEIVEEGEGLTSSLQHQIQTIADEITHMPLRRKWKRADIITEIRDLAAALDDNLAAAAVVARDTAADPLTKYPTRISHPGNPHLQTVRTALLIAAADTAEPTAPVIPLHPDAHPFEADGTRRECRRCEFPEANARHQVPAPARNDHNSSYVTRAQRRPGQHVPYFDPPDISVYKRSKI